MVPVMDPLRICLAGGPLAVYLLLLAIINLRRSALVVGGALDLGLLGLAASGMILVGPVELLTPEPMLVHFSPYIWPLLLVMYWAVLSLVVMLARPRLTIYNVETDLNSAGGKQFHAWLESALQSLDAGATWSDRLLILPRLHISLELEDHLPMRNVTLIATSNDQSLDGWRELQRALSSRLGEIEARPHVWGVGLLIAALLMLGRLGWELAAHPQMISQEFCEMLRLY
jgi:hypothetical protein